MQNPRAKKSLGQHFLAAPSYVRQIAEVGGASDGQVVLEVGPGTGLLTRELLSQGAKVIAVEKDDRMIPLLTEQFAQELKTKQLRLVHGDILEENLRALGLRAGKYRVIANIPYYISGMLLRFFLTHTEQPATMTLLVQKEVAERIARSKKESLLSLSVKAYGEPEFIKKVPRGAFSPAPSVDSAILTIKNISRNHFVNPSHEKLFFTLLHAGFAHKRKKLGKAIAPHIGPRASGVTDARAEDISLQGWLSLSNPT